MKRRIYRIVAVIGAVLFILIIYRLLTSKLFQKDDGEKEYLIPVTTVEVVTGDIRDTLFYSGDIQGEEQAIVYPVISGTLLRYYVEEGERVRKGETLALLKRLETWEEYKPVVVESPISGIVGYNYLDVGEIATLQTPVSLVVGGEGLRVTLKVSDTELGLIDVGMPAEVRVPTAPDIWFEGVVSKVSPILNSDTRTAYVEVFIDERPKQVWPGMFGDVRIIIEEKTDVTIVPTDVIMYAGDEMVDPYCFVLNDGVTHKRDLELGITEGVMVEVVAGISPGELIVDLGKENVDEGVEVEVIEGEVTEGEVTEGEVTEGEVTEGEVTEGEVIEEESASE
ncbi:MAG: efflux RND transporter periplasmic adaptor subunit [Deltaproteobacteria bacterium]|nr:efflux RND transporter periplasmic adaptor subunit [Candidatus Zymogenaceae bacterium]